MLYLEEKALRYEQASGDSEKEKRPFKRKTLQKTKGSHLLWSIGSILVDITVEHDARLTAFYAYSFRSFFLNIVIPELSNMNTTEHIFNSRFLICEFVKTFLLETFQKWLLKCQTIITTGFLTAHTCGVQNAAEQKVSFRQNYFQVHTASHSLFDSPKMLLV